MIEVMLQAGLIPVVTGVVQVCRTAGLPSKLAPLASLAFGVLAVVALLAEPLPQEILQGIVVGLAASGFYSGVKRQFTAERAGTF